MDLIVQRFTKGHPFYSEVSTMHNSQAYQAVFGRLISAKDGSLICYTMERKDTLTAEGEYKFTYYFSPLNKTWVPLLHDVPGFEFIELHIANFPYEVKGCTALGQKIDVNKPMLIGSGNAFNALMHQLAGTTGKIKYETLKQQ